MKIFSFRQTISGERSEIRLFADGLTKLLVPPTCPLCGVATDDDVAPRDSPAGIESCWCNRCRVELSVNRFQHRSACHGCGLRLPVDDFGLGGNSRFCSTCESDFDRPIDRTIAAFQYNGQVCKAIVAAKYTTGHAIGRGLGLELSNAFQQQLATDRRTESSTDPGALPPGSNGSPIDFVTYVPSHVTRRFVRGGCGISAITRTFAAQIGVPLVSCLQTTRRMQKQAWLNDRGRKQNVCGAFAVKKSYDSVGGQPPWSGCHVVLVDDVMTTGSTCREVARVLRDAGAARVTAAVVARANRS